MRLFSQLLMGVSFVVGVVLLFNAFRSNGTSSTINALLGALLVFNACARLMLSRMKRRGPRR